MEVGAKIVGLKLGYRGLYLRTGGGASGGWDGPGQRTCSMGQPGDLESCFQVNVVGTARSGGRDDRRFPGALLRDLSPEDV